MVQTLQKENISIQENEDYLLHDISKELQNNLINPSEKCVLNLFQQLEQLSTQAEKMKEINQ